MKKGGSKSIKKLTSSTKLNSIEKEEDDAMESVLRFSSIIAI